MMTLKKTKVVHVNKGNDKIVITWLMHNSSMSPMTCRKIETTISTLVKQANGHTILLKLVETHDIY